MTVKQVYNIGPMQSALSVMGMVSSRPCSETSSSRQRDVQNPKSGTGEIIITKGAVSSYFMIKIKKTLNLFILLMLIF